MTNAFYQIVMLFARYVGMETLLAESSLIITGATLLIALLCCFFGYHLFRILSAGVAFFLTAAGICELLRWHADMGVIVTTFAVVGMIMAFLTYHGYKLSAFLICTLIGYSLSSLFTDNVLVLFGVSAVLGVVSILLSDLLVILSTSIWGAITIGLDGLSLLGENRAVYMILASVLLGMAGIWVQFLLTKENRMANRSRKKKQKPDNASANKVFRKELKYTITVLDFSHLQKQLEFYIKPDKHSGDNGYRVRSLYFDSDKDQDLLDTLDGNMEKRKIRLRFYPPDKEHILLEYKCKSGTDGIKQSIKLSPEEAKQMISGDYRFLFEHDDPLARTLYVRLMLGGYRPKTIVEYIRKAYVYPVSDTRITFDSNVSASYVVDSFFDENPGLVPLMAHDKGILEVKYNHFLVRKLKQALESVDTLNNAYSKYAQSRQSV